MDQKYISTLNIQQLFDGSNYIIPIYQRNFAWEEAQIVQLIQDIYDSETENYYLGSLVVFKKEINSKNYFETIDGQQRLTTLNILLSVLKHEYKEENNINYKGCNLSFYSRDISSKTLAALYDHGNMETSLIQDTAMINAYNIIVRKLFELFGNGKNNALQKFIFDLSSKVKIMRVEVPENTDLNHYFEVMNNRGEQLEKHEILKAKCLNVLSKSDDAENDRKTFSEIWEACSQMDRYVQYAYHIDYRKSIFGIDWDNLPQDFEEIKKKTISVNLKDTEGENDALINIIKKPEVDRPEKKGLEDDGQAQFTTVVSFSNFLLHVLRVSYGRNVQLDDKKLIQEFEKYLFEDNNLEEKIEAVREFGYDLLKCKFLFDQYIVKRAFRNGYDNWALLKLKKQKNENRGYYVGTFGEEDGSTFENKKLVMLLSMFHVSFPQTMYKHWLTGALNYLYDAEEQIQASNYIQYLEKMSDAFFFDRLNSIELDYFDIIFENKCNIQNRELTDEDIENNLNNGTNVQNFIFNRLDYLLWKNFEANIEKVSDRDSKYCNLNTNTFEFAFRSSVEHYAPQHPKNGLPAFSNVDNLGNLCLISRSKNSELSNYAPYSKKEHYYEQKTIESLKQRLMMCYLEWNEDTVNEHQENMITVLKSITN
ncbi:DUF262 domain-containing protein [Winogradskyella sp. UBA3174]|uniref:DUF262 domain-containing protein n=1 Tax=Winogradskyella sp. UBA3174 TaxID=1947785 RepID=UPI0025DB4DE3|nr:DUF262 domain-containing HNH endonuclease family protein [Winogradskyella sp. UBA3174]|tara:strand:- start:143984 stop:145933 length:1950 start_codon:yes stop_codon:yes gene_type:complete